MSIEETQELLRPIFALDGRRLTPEVVTLWHSLLTPRATLKDAKMVARQWLTENDGLLKPAHINAGVLALRKKRMPSRADIEMAVYTQHVPAEIDNPAFRDNLMRRLGDGEDLDHAVASALHERPSLEARKPVPRRQYLDTASFANQISQAIPERNTR